MSAEDMYQETILDYYRNPVNFGTLEHVDASARDVNPSCGDQIEMQLKVNNGVVEDVRFSGKGCAISIASASMLTEEIKGKKVEEALKVHKEKVFELLNIKLSMMRVKCALLGLKVLKMSLYQYLGDERNVTEEDC